MKRETMLSTALLGVALVAGLAWMGQGARAQSRETGSEKRTVQTYGTATVRVRPDRARVFFGIQTFAPAIKQARAQNAVLSRQVTEALAALKIPDLKMKSTNLTVELVRSEVEDRVPKILGYRVTNTFTVLVSNSQPDELGPLASRVLDTALENGANQVEQVVFFRENETDGRRDALAKAVADARGNAEAMAAGAGKRIVDVVSIDGTPEFAYARAFANSTNGAQSNLGDGNSTALMAGEQEITCTVNVTFQF